VAIVRFNEHADADIDYLFARSSANHRSAIPPKLETCWRLGLALFRARAQG
jgi:hypothetical protein